MRLRKSEKSVQTERDSGRQCGWYPRSGKKLISLHQGQLTAEDAGVHGCVGGVEGRDGVGMAERFGVRVRLALPACSCSIEGVAGEHEEQMMTRDRAEVFGQRRIEVAVHLLPIRSPEVARSDPHRRMCGTSFGWRILLV